ncbi:MAG: DUF805 domain-containing protein [Bacteroidota bacterium]
MDALAHYLDVLARFADFDGRASRAQFWGFWVVHAIVTLVLLAASVAVGLVLGLAWIGGSAVLALYLAASFFPALSLLARRLHDVGRSSFFVALALVPIAGLVVLYWCLLPSEPAPNAWGRPPA